MIPARLRRPEPDGGVAAGEHVALHTKRRNEKVMDDILAGHGELDVTADRHVELINLHLPFGVLELPHPLFADDVDLHRLWRRTLHGHEKARTPAEHHHGEKKG